MFREFIISVLRKSGFVRKKWVTGKIRDKEFRVLANTIRTKPDKDDAWLFELSRHCRNVFDIGSNIGQAAMQMLFHDNVKKIILVDPNPAALTAAAENLVHNNFSMRAQFVNAFISERCNESVEFYTEDSGAAGSRYPGFAKTAAQHNSHYQVSTLTVDYLVEYFNIIPDLVKIDVEGAEREVLAGSSKLAARGTSLFFVEVHSGPELSITDNTSGILDWCRKNNYSAWYLKDKKTLTVDDIRNRGRYHALLTPGMNPIPESLMNINESDPLK